MTQTVAESGLVLTEPWWTEKEYTGAGELYLPGQSKLGAKDREVLERINSVADAAKLDIPAMPEAALEATRLMKDPDVEIEAVTSVIERDVAMCGQVLRAANSPLFGARFPIDTVSRAVNHLGMARLKTVLLEIAMNRVSGGIRARGYAKMEWRYASACAAICRALGRQFKLDVELCHLAGLMHDIGRLPVISALHEEGMASGTPIEDSATEVIIETLHRGVGLQVAEAWELPPALKDAIGKHLNARGADEPSLAGFPSTKVAEAAGDLCYAIGQGRFRKPFDILACRSLLDLGFDRQSLATFLRSELPAIIENLSSGG